MNTLGKDAQQIIRKGQKLIKIADRSKDGWLVLQEYESDDLASNSEDEKHRKNAENVAEKKRKNSERSKLVRNVFKSNNEKQLFAVMFILYLLYFYYFSIRHSNHQIALFVLYVLHLRGK